MNPGATCVAGPPLIYVSAAGAPPPPVTGLVHARYAKVGVPVHNVRFGFMPQGVAGP
jgi:hypothetical protein